jgi:hypothetical protein
MSPDVRPLRVSPALPSGAGSRLRRVVAAVAGVALLAAVFAAYLDPDRVLDFGQLMLLCGFR